MSDRPKFMILRGALVALAHRFDVTWFPRAMYRYRRLGIAVVGLALCLIFTEEAVPAPRDPADPPPLDELLKTPRSSPRHPPSTVIQGSYEGIPDKGLNCDVAQPDCFRYLKGVSIYNQVHRCWDPREKLKVSGQTWIHLSDDKERPGGGIGLSSRASHSILLVSFRLNPDGTVAAPKVDALGPERGRHTFSDDLARAIERCQPYKFEPDLSDTGWEDVGMMLQVEEPSSNANKQP